jgi:hypothetical protein
MSLCQCQARRSWEAVDVDEVKRRPGVANTCLFALRLREEYEWARVSSASQRRASSGRHRVSSTWKAAWTRSAREGNEYWRHAMPSLPRNPPIRRGAFIRRIHLSMSPPHLDSRRTPLIPFLLIVAPSLPPEL